MIVHFISLVFSSFIIYKSNRSPFSVHLVCTYLYLSFLSFTIFKINSSRKHKYVHTFIDTYSHYAHTETHTDALHTYIYTYVLHTSKHTCMHAYILAYMYIKFLLHTYLLNKYSIQTTYIVYILEMITRYSYKNIIQTYYKLTSKYASISRMI